ncbi:MAG: hypothetical protein CL693_16380 [Cellvibrionaceae bacterium]|nr:hypothetical protein [Cellvibrionaceae bacterium]
MPNISQAIKQAHLALAKRDFAVAHQQAMTVLQQDPHCADGYFVMAQIAYEHGNVRKAEEVVARALKFSPSHIDCQLFRFQCWLELNQREQLLAGLIALEIDRFQNAHQFDCLGVIYSRLGMHEDALPLFEKACGLKPLDASYQYNLASCYQFSGQFELADQAYEQALVIDPAHYRSHSSLSQLKRQTQQSNHIDRLLEQWAQLNENSVDAYLHLGHALAKEYEDLEEYDLAFQYLTEGKQRKSKSTDYLPEHDRKNIETIKKLMPRLDERASASELSVVTPIFIVGMPRTGTTLVERILSSHDEVISAGELANFSMLVKQLAKTSSQWVLDEETLAKSIDLDFQSLGDAYLKSTQRFLHGKNYFIDKMPLNYMYVPLILKALPQAKIVCVQRNPMDTCLSNYRQLFSTQYSYYNYAYNLSDTGEYFVGFNQLLSEYRQRYGSRLHFLSYENVVSDIESESQRLLEYCDLPWQSQCLQFHDNQAPVATASSVQVREKLYTRGLNRWRVYEEHLGDLKSIFNDNHIQW